MDSKVYLDHAASTPVDPIVLEAMAPHFSDIFANPASSHRDGQRSEAAVETAREQISSLLNCTPAELVFTSGGTESDNLALRGAAIAARIERNADHILISPVEHPAVSKTARHLKEIHGFELEYLPVDTHGMVAPDDLATMVRPDTAVVSVIYANNEIGSINPISELGAVCRSRGVPFHTDGVQAAAHLPIDLVDLNVDLFSFGAHKFNGPKGIGALYVRSGTPLTPIQTGGGQENQRRSGTLNTPAIVGMASALHLAQEHRDDRREKVMALRDHLISRVLEEIPTAHLTGHPTKRLPNHASFIFDHVDGNRLVASLDVQGFACSSASACKVGTPEPSEVLLALGCSPQHALSSLRVSLSHLNQPDEIDRFLDCLPEVVSQCRSQELNVELP
ncbi:MAG: cysteine desulfurase [Anaerolineae bacterium]|nr:cysteine desulfurase [Anaerolineae bacterium]